MNINQFFNSQLEKWELARQNYADLSLVQTKVYKFNDFSVYLQFNPARMISTTAKIDTASIAARKCFLCKENRPAEQDFIAWRDYHILVNPFPIFPKHFVIAKQAHVDQAISPNIADMLALAKHMPDYAIFYNGPKAGASAPDHMHFQACEKFRLPIISDYHNMKYSVAEMSIDNYFRTVHVIESEHDNLAISLFGDYVNSLSCYEGEEPMMNVVAVYQDNKYFVFILPRSKYRPSQYGLQGLLVSPGAVEMCGVFITPIEDHYNKIKYDDIIDILKQVTFNEGF